MKGRIVTATFDVATPLFSAGADQTGVEVRASAFVGALAFWWRALAWSRASVEAKPLEWLKQREAQIFGSASTGQGAFLVRRVTAQGYRKSANDAGAPAGLSGFQSGNDLPWKKSGSGVKYLLGPGIRGPRACLLPLNAATLRVELLLKPSTPSDSVADLVGALKALGTFGGFGARSRRGLGSICLRSVTASGAFHANGEASDPENLFSAPSSVDGLREQIESIRASPAVRPPYSAFSKEAAVCVIDLRGQDGGQALNWMGHHYQLFRSWGNNGKVGGQRALRRAEFEPDHDWFQKSRENGPFARHPNETVARAQFGLPLPFFKMDQGPKTLVVKPDGHERRASPLFMHVHRLAPNHHAIVLLLLDAGFLPNTSEQLVAKRNSGSDRNQRLKAPTDFKHVRAFLDWIATQVPDPATAGAS